MRAMTRGLTPAVGPDDHVQGSAGAAVTLVEYGDYECPYCGQAYPIIKRLQQRLGAQLRFVFRNFPLSTIHPNAAAAAEFAEAAGSQGKFWEAHDMLFENQHAISDTDLVKYVDRLAMDAEKLKDVLLHGEPTRRVQSDFMSGVRSGVNGTPTFFINGTRFDDNWSDEERFASFLLLSAAGR